MSPHGCVHGVSKEVHPTSGEYPNRILKDQCQPNAGLRVTSPETRFKAIPGSLGRRLPVGSQSQGKLPASRLVLQWILL